MKNKDFFYLGLIILIVAVLYLAISINNAFNNTEIRSDIETYSTPIDPNFNTETLNEVGTSAKSIFDIEPKQIYDITP